MLNHQRQSACIFYNIPKWRCLPWTFIRLLHLPICTAVSGRWGRYKPIDFDEFWCPLANAFPNTLERPKLSLGLLLSMAKYVAHQVWTCHSALSTSSKTIISGLRKFLIFILGILHYYISNQENVLRFPRSKTMDSTCGIHCSYHVAHHPAAPGLIIWWRGLLKLSYNTS